MRNSLRSVGSVIFNSTIDMNVELITEIDSIDEEAEQ